MAAAASMIAQIRGHAEHLHDRTLKPMKEPATSSIII